jgi:hypothetical protein
MNELKSGTVAAELLGCVFAAGLSDGPDDAEYRTRLMGEIENPEWITDGWSNDWEGFVPECLRERWNVMSSQEKIIAYLVSFSAKQRSCWMID